MKNQIEKWVDSYYFPDLHEVSNFGRIRNKLTKKYYTPQKEGSNRYWRVTFKQNNKKFTIRLHRLVYFSFNPNTPQNLHIHHLDHDKNNNKLSNLISIDKKKHASIHAKINIQNGFGLNGLDQKGVNHPKSKGFVLAICPKTYEIKHIIVGGYDISSNCKITSLGFYPSIICRVLQGKFKQHNGFFFKRIPKTKKVKVGDIFSEKLLTSK
jgi:hypothetical protein